METLKSYIVSVISMPTWQALQGTKKDGVGGRFEGMETNG